VGHLEIAEGAGPLGMWLALRDALPVEVGDLLDQVVILQRSGPSGPMVSECSSLATGIPASVVAGLGW
jgi:hypothetical protein